MKWLPWAIGASIGALFLLGGVGTASAAQPAAAGRRARVIPNARGGIMTRTEPSARGGVATLISPEGTSPNDAFNGTVVDVLETGHKDADGKTGGEWWKIRTPGGGVGFARAVDPAGVRNFEDM